MKFNEMLTYLNIKYELETLLNSSDMRKMKVETKRCSCYVTYKKNEGIELLRTAIYFKSNQESIVLNSFAGITEEYMVETLEQHLNDVWGDVDILEVEGPDRGS